MHQRIAEIGTAHRAVNDHPVIGPVIDDGEVHGLGYSLGSATLMAGSIAAVDIAALKSHCYANAAKPSILQIAKPVCVDVSRASNHWQRSFGVTSQTTRFGDNRQDGACCAGWPRSDPATNPQEN